MRRLVFLLVTAVAGCSSSNCPSGEDCAWKTSAEGACTGTAWVDAGLLAGGGPGTALASSSFSSLGARVILATNAAAACALETDVGLATGPNVSGVRLTLAPGLAPGTYALGSSAVTASYAFSTTCFGGYATRSPQGTVTLSRVDPSSGVAGSYWLDWGPSSVGGGGGTLPDGGILSCGPLGELFESGAFDAAPCEACAAPPGCGDAGCPSGQICSRRCGGPDGQCIPAPSCQGAPSCSNCAADIANTCGSRGPMGGGGGCGFYDGFSLICNCAP